jgi:hypothetical protein
MTFDQVWAALVRKSPELANGDTRVEFRAEKLRLLLQQVYCQGLGAVAEARRERKEEPSLFEKMFGIGER